MRPHTGPAQPNGSPGEQLLRAGEQRLAPVELRLLDDLVEQRRERPAELRARAVPDRDQVGAVDGEVGQPVRTAQLALDRLAEAVQPVDLVLVARAVGSL